MNGTMKRKRKRTKNRRATERTSAVRRTKIH